MAHRTPKARLRAGVRRATLAINVSTGGGGIASECTPSAVPQLGDSAAALPGGRPRQRTSLRRQVVPGSLPRGTTRSPGSARFWRHGFEPSDRSLERSLRLIILETSATVRLAWVGVVRRSDGAARLRRGSRPRRVTALLSELERVELRLGHLVPEAIERPGPAHRNAAIVRWEPPACRLSCQPMRSSVPLTRAARVAGQRPTPRRISSRSSRSRARLATRRARGDPPARGGRAPGRGRGRPRRSRRRSGRRGDRPPRRGRGPSSSRSTSTR